MTPEWVDYLGAFSALGAAVLAGVALVFAVKAGRDLTHDRRDTFEIGVFREMLALLDIEHLYWPPPWLGQMQTLRDLIDSDLPQVDLMLAKYPDLGIGSLVQSVEAHYARLVGEEDKLVERHRIGSAVRDEINAEIRNRTGRSRHAAV